MNDAEFLALSDRALRAIGAALDRAIDASDADIDWNENDGVLTIDCGAGGRIIVNRHLPNRELWLAARDGGKHFRLERERWSDTRSGAGLVDELAQALDRQSGVLLDRFELPVR